jgi:D-aminopeptidase
VAEDAGTGRPFTHEVRMLDDAWISGLFWAAIESTEEAIVNALVAAETMAGQGGHVAHRLPHDRLREVWQRHRG